MADRAFLAAQRASGERLGHDPDPERRVSAKCEAVFPRDKRGTRLRGDHAQTKPYSMNWSARASAPCAMSRPSCFAVFRLMASQNLSGNCTGILAGLLPLRISAIMAAQRRGTALKSAEYEIKPPTL